MIQIMALVQYMNNKKGLSSVVATISLVLITVVAAVFIAGFVVPFVRDTLNEGTECVGYENYFTFYEEFDYNCYKREDVFGGGYHYLYALSIGADSVSQGKLDNIGGLRIQFLGGGESVGVEVKNNSNAGNSVGEIRMLDLSSTKLTLPENGGVKTYVYNSSVKFDSVEIYPILKNERMCKQTDGIQIGRACDNGVLLNV